MEVGSRADPTHRMTCPFFNNSTEDAEENFWIMKWRASRGSFFGPSKSVKKSFNCIPFWIFFLNKSYPVKKRIVGVWESEDVFCQDWYDSVVFFWGEGKRETYQKDIFRIFNYCSCVGFLGKIILLFCFWVGKQIISCY